MSLRWIIFVCLCVSVLSTSAAIAETRYVSDQLVITLREGMGNQYRVIKTLKTDTPMEVLSEKGRYLFVKLADGSEGYVLKQYIAKKMPTTLRVKKLSAEVEQLRQQQEQQQQLTQKTQAESAMLRQQLSEANSSLTLNEELLKNTKAELSDLQMKAENVLLIDQERQRLKGELSAATKELEQLRQDNKAMLNTAMIKWFVAGGGVLFIGWVAGKFSRKKKRSLGSF